MRSNNEELVVTDDGHGRLKSREPEAKEAYLTFGCFGLQKMYWRVGPRLRIASSKFMRESTLGTPHS